MVVSECPVKVFPRTAFGTINKTRQRLFWTWAKKRKVGKMNVVNTEANKALGESYNLTHWNPHLRTLVNRNRSIKILEMWNGVVF